MISLATKAFKSLDNKLLSCILDFSDGVITQSIANLRLMMKHNISILQQNEFGKAFQNIP